MNSLLRTDGVLIGVQRGWVPAAVSPPRNAPPIDDTTRALNLRIIQDLGREARESAGRLVIVDAVRYSNPRTPAISSELEELCFAKGFGYISLSDPLLRANQDGVATHWKHDGHFNEAGKRIFAVAMYQWMVREGKSE